MQDILALGGTRTTRLASLLVPVTVLAFTVDLVVWVWHSSLVKLTAIVPDDAAYYLQIACNAVDGHGFTFDQLHRTNGFQPLWQWFLVLPAQVARTTPDNFFRIALTIQVLILAMALLALFRVLSRDLPAIALLPGAVVFGTLVFVRGVNGMESGFAAALLALLTAFVLRGRVFRRGAAIPQLSWGGLLGLLMLSRLDFTLLGGLVCLAILVRGILLREEFSEHLLCTVRVFAGASIPMAPYLACNLISTGHLLPISALLKGNFPHGDPAGFQQIPLVCQGIVAVALAWAAIVGVLVLSGWNSGRRLGGHRMPTPLEAVVAVLGGFIVLHALYTGLFLDWAVMFWHFASYWFFISLASVAVAARVFRMLPQKVLHPAGYWPLMVLVMALAFYQVEARQARTTDNWHTAVLEAAAWVRTDTPEDAVFAMTDAGNFGFFSRRRTVNLDGVVNDFEFQDALKGGEITRYLHQAGVDYYVQHAVPVGENDTFAPTFESHFYKVRSKPLVLRR